jgi:hypothetical protein
VSFCLAWRLGREQNGMLGTEAGQEIQKCPESPVSHLPNHIGAEICAGKEASIASCTLTGRYILPLFLMRPVRCAACFPRDYRVIFTLVRERSHRHDSSARHSTGNAVSKWLQSS